MMDVRPVDVRDGLLLLALFVAAAVAMFVILVDPWTAVRICPPGQIDPCPSTE